MDGCEARKRVQSVEWWQFPLWVPYPLCVIASKCLHRRVRCAEPTVQGHPAWHHTEDFRHAWPVSHRGG